MAMIIMAANAAAIAGAQVFRTEDKPLYHTAFTSIVALAAVTFAIVIFQTVWYMASNRRLKSKKHDEVPTVEGAGLVEKWQWQW
ncbi:MAG: hypothetical protein M1818_008485 [Claussenomyces sp. TS43310]|nr:MAG: hypothetical protein M1818_008485 [Claussenomyces sp. TS43310]